jgi:hypothetical protein
MLYAYAYDEDALNHAHEINERAPQCPLCKNKNSNCGHLIGEGDSWNMEWGGGLSYIPEVWAYLHEARHSLRQVFESVPPWDEIEDGQAPEDFLLEHHPKAGVCTACWDAADRRRLPEWHARFPDGNGYVYYVYMTEEDQAQASKDLRRLKDLILNPSAYLLLG